MSKKTSIVFKGKRVNGENLDFETVKESWNQYQAEDGTLIKFKSIISLIVRLDERKSDGEPIYVVKSTNIVESDVPEHLVHKPRKKGEIN